MRIVIELTDEKPDLARVSEVVEALLKPQAQTSENRDDATPIDDLGLSVRVRNALRNVNVLTLADLCKMTRTDLVGVPSMGRTSRDEIDALLTTRGLWLADEAPEHN